MNDTDGNPVVYREWYWAKISMNGNTRTCIGKFKRLGRTRALVFDSCGLLIDSRNVVCFTLAHVPNEYQEN